MHESPSRTQVSYIIFRWIGCVSQGSPGKQIKYLICLHSEIGDPSCPTYLGATVNGELGVFMCFREVLPIFLILLKVVCSLVRRNKTFPCMSFIFHDMAKYLMRSNLKE